MADDAVYLPYADATRDVIRVGGKCYYKAGPASQNPDLGVTIEAVYDTCDDCASSSSIPAGCPCSDDGTELFGDTITAYVSGIDIPLGSCFVGNTWYDYDYYGYDYTGFGYFKFKNFDVSGMYCLTRDDPYSCEYYTDIDVQITVTPYGGCNDSMVESFDITKVRLSVYLWWTGDGGAIPFVSIYGIEGNFPDYPYIYFWGITAFTNDYASTDPLTCGGTTTVYNTAYYCDAPPDADADYVMPYTWWEWDYCSPPGIQVGGTIDLYDETC